MGGTSDYGIDDLPRFSPWPARLLGLDPWEPKHKTPLEVTREFEYEKWGPLLKEVREAQRDVTVEEVDSWMARDAPTTLCSIGNRLECLSPAQAHQKYLNLVESVLMPFLPATALVELGAGYGSMILALCKRMPFAQMPIFAGEYTASGIELIRRLAKTQLIMIETGHCDFGSPQVVDFSIPQGAVIFTSFAMHYLPTLTSNCIKKLSASHPRAVVHFEPCYEHCDNQNLLGLMRKRYIEVNDYNTNLVSLLRSQQDQGLIQIIDERPAVFGRNPLFAASVMVWSLSLHK